MALAVISVCQRPSPRLNTLEFNAWSKEATLKIKTHGGREKKCQHRLYVVECGFIGAASMYVKKVTTLR